MDFDFLVLPPRLNFFLLNFFIVLCASFSSVRRLALLSTSSVICLFFSFNCLLCSSLVTIAIRRFASLEEEENLSGPPPP